MVTIPSANANGLCNGHPLRDYKLALGFYRGKVELI